MSGRVGYQKGSLRFLHPEGEVAVKAANARNRPGEADMSFQAKQAMNGIAEQMATLEEACLRASRHHHDILTPRKREVALLVERNLSNYEIASNFGH